MANLFSSPIVDRIIKLVYNYGHDQYRWQTGMKEELQRLQENRFKIEAVVSASTQLQIGDGNPAIDAWRRQLRDACDETNKVLDDFEKPEEEQQELNKEGTKVRFQFIRSFWESPSKFRRVCQRGLKIDPKLERLEAAVKKIDNALAEVGPFLFVIENEKQEQRRLDCQLYKARQTGPYPTDVLIGRNTEKDFVMQWLRRRTNENIARPTLYKNISLLSMVGHGGMGKTALLQHIYQDLKKEFKLKMWVYVSKDFDAIKVISDMLAFLGEERPPLESTLAYVQYRLEQVVKFKRFLLVLDDIWEEENTSKWENVLSPLVHGSSGSKILLTTRMDSVASAIANVIKKKKEQLRIKGFEEDVCLEQLKAHTFPGEENLGAHTILQILGAHTNLTDIASSIFKEHSGSPLATKFIGNALSSNLNESFLMKILNSANVLNVEPELGHNNILLILRLSFPFPQQPLQTHSAFRDIFSQYPEFDGLRSVRMWTVLDFILKSSIEGETLEDNGGRYFDVLVENSFFDEFQDENRLNKMNDFLHRLAQSISSEKCFRFVGDTPSSLKIPITVRHLFVKTENLEVLRTIENIKNLHSLFLISATLTDEALILTKIFEASRRIRLLFICSPSPPSSG